MKNKLITFEKYIRRVNFSNAYAKKNMLIKFKELFKEELLKWVN